MTPDEKIEQEIRARVSALGQTLKWKIDDDLARFVKDILRLKTSKEPSKPEPGLGPGGECLCYECVESRKWKEAEL